MVRVHQDHVSIVAMIGDVFQRAVGVCVAAAALAVPASVAVAVSLDSMWATVGDPGNAPDDTGYGAVPYVFRISKTEVTIGQYTAFLNAVAASDPYGLYNPNMGSYTHVSGVARSGAPGSYSYSATAPIGSAPLGASSATARPITFVSWFDAARFANWMHNGMGSGDTEDGAYTLNGATGGPAPVRNAGALYSIPTEDEWYKAAYYKGGGTNAGYWEYATQSDTQPDNQIGNLPNQANYFQLGRATVTGLPFLTWNQNYLTDVGAFSGSPSAYGTYDQTGNVLEWNDLNGSSSTLRGLRGGEWDHYVNLDASSRSWGETGWESHTIGFRLARATIDVRTGSVPEVDPAGVPLVVALVVMAMLVRERHRC
ncbi:MAG: SUMF1/EgtB/PvdO family nonheme iron enzyme [Planctomycetes bacterium]|nr:SUMF1/EgtB/PvdO family nonheme iron enzyme [Planctomycetota bacterium]